MGMLDKNTLRTLIRDVIAEEVRHVKAGLKPADAGSVRIASDADLTAFAKSVLTLAEDPKIRAAIQAGRHPFHLAGGSAAPATASAPASETHRIDKGVVTESSIARLPKGTTRLVVAAGVSVTPLARDKAKARNISIERIGP
jgi:hypothetical protein